MRRSGINLPPIALEKAVRVGNKTDFEKNRPILVNFTHVLDRNLLFDKREHVKRVCNVKIVEDFCEHTDSKRKDLAPFVIPINKFRDNEGKAPYNAILKHDKLSVNGKHFTKKTLHNLPEDIKPEQLFTKTVNNTTGFFRKWSPLSNHYIAQQTVNNKTYNCNEQYYCHQKAKYFGDNETAERILSETDPALQKKLSRSIKDVDENKWRSRNLDIMRTGLLAKFRQNPELKSFLINTGEATLAECNPTDRFWGVGMAVDNINVYRKNSWLGTAQNHLGRLLMDIRRELST